jgi:hypothetical protein
MKIDPAEQSTDEATEAATASVVDESTSAGADETVDGDESTDKNPSPGSAIAGGAEPLTIGLPDGTESVSEAILSHRQMLTEPSEHGLVSASEAEEVRETVDDLAERVPEDLRGEMDALEASIDEMAAGLDRQERQIQELRDTVASLAEILGASVEFQTGDEREE